MKLECLKTNSETDKVLLSILNRHFLSTPVRDGLENSDAGLIELFFKASCPSNCEYCYLHRNRKNLYPIEIENEEQILKNYISFLNFYEENKLNNRLEFFSGRMMDSDFGLKVLEIGYNHYKNSIYKPESIMIPDDMQFILDDEQTNKIKSYIYKYQEIGIHIIFSASVDGKIVDYKRFHGREDEFYNKLSLFMEEFEYCYHPIVSAHAIDKWEENLDWWINYTSHGFKNIMFLEARNDEWTDEILVSYIKLLDKTFDYLKEFYKDDDIKFLKGLFNMQEDKRFEMRKLVELRLKDPVFYHSDRISCAIQNTLHLRMGDLAIVPCHRLGYPQYVTGYFKTNENNEIVELISNNVPFNLLILNSKTANMPKCHKCPINMACMGPCLGANFESTQEALYAPDSVCDLFKHNITFVILKLKSLKLYDKALEVLEDKQYLLKQLNDYVEHLNKPSGWRIYKKVQEIIEGKEYVNN